MTILKVALATSGLFLAIVLASLAYNPRVWVQDFPNEVQAEMEPLSRGERLVRALLAAVLVLVVVGIPLASVLRIKSTTGGVGFRDAFTHLWVVFMVVNIVDLVIIDVLIGRWWRPDILDLPDIESVGQHLTYRFHVVEHLKGTVMLTALALVLGSLLSL